MFRVTFNKDKLKKETIRKCLRSPECQNEINEKDDEILRYMMNQ